jgi:hypothetical protein
VREIIEIWLNEEGLQAEAVDDEGAIVHLSLTYPPGSPFRIDLVQPRREPPDLLLVGTGVTVADHHREAFRRLTPDDRRSFLWEFCYLLGDRPTEFELHHPDFVLEQFSVTSPVYLDGLTKDRFMAAVRDVHRTKLLGIWKIQEFGDEPEGPGLRGFRKDLGI